MNCFAPIQIWTDGACSGNPGPGASAAVIRRNDETLQQLIGRELGTTNQRMEIMSVMMAFEHLVEEDTNNDTIEIYADSAYVCNCFVQKWYENWLVNGWMNSKRQPVKNQDLWERLISAFELLKRKGNTIYFIKVKGHNGNKWNERADWLASHAIHMSTIDLGWL